MKLQLVSHFAPQVNQSKEIMVQYLKSDAPDFAIYLLDHFPLVTGQGLRPSLLLAASAITAKSPDLNNVNNNKAQWPSVQLLKAAAAIEMIHSGSLLHDDVIDEATLRRHKPTINNLFGAREATILGDYFLSRAFTLILEIKDPNITEAFIRLLDNMVKGELLEFNYNEEKEPSEEAAREIMELKTASLFSTASLIGGILSNKGEKEIKALSDFGRFAGIAFQITDDLLDITSPSTVAGKDTGNDIVQRKPTLPLIYALKRVGNSDLKELYQNKTTVPEKIRELLNNEAMRKETELESQKFTEKAIASLSCFSDNKAKETLIEFAKFTTKRSQS